MIGKLHFDEEKEVISEVLGHIHYPMQREFINELYSMRLDGNYSTKHFFSRVILRGT